MDNKNIRRAFKLMASLMELHDENAFKIRGYQNAVAALERVDAPMAGMTEKELESYEGVGKSIAAKIVELNQTGSFSDLNKLLEVTPAGVVEMLNIKGFGPKKIRAIWKELGIENTADLLQACENDQIAKLKGFGAKTQETLKNALLYSQESKGKLLWAEAEIPAEDLKKILQETLQTDNVEITGEFRRKLEIINLLQLVIATENPVRTQEKINEISALQQDEKLSGPFAWRGTVAETGLKVEMKLVSEADFVNEVFKNSAADMHLSLPYNGSETLYNLLKKVTFKSEAEVYEKAGLQFIYPELREGLGELELAAENKLPKLLEDTDLKGILHNHSTYSDGANTLEQMAVFCKEQGYQYLGMCDHSKSAFYANGLQEGRVVQQQKEIDKLNEQLSPFKIFKGIESDILNDGSLDYEEDILKTFDFVVASVHSTLNMTCEKATQRLITAIQNPYTTMLGHPTGRLLLRREGYPIDHQAVIDACAENGVIIEINANPWRLDLDWRWVSYALEKGVMLSINPDAHSTTGYADMRYGVLMGRKGGLSAEMTFNAKSREEVEAYFVERKKEKGIL
ncbi:DNA polymerase/3'-5' exonuclease PolX [Adhaeribacter sp. BT258]|uniref:DNA polymerase/3'-5' exonuclease PolX n=1 Tax=Adhaeribacter terrigena TaxID=2793070 RepID=A0ABS1C415_9BACT|nr:DNA polymerase/3'-5' exonuclease PolX [Adhaeribacter terrigena]MBK0404140.1 DNA polymerase/3'-5' exonuclease PolX [Adhaeribacter terrigena]